MCLLIENEGLVPHEEDCSSYYECNYYHPTQHFCEYPNLYDYVRKTCMPPDRVQCFGNIELSSPQVPRTTANIISNIPSNADCINGNMFIPHPSNRSKFFICIEGTIFELQCPENLVWNNKSSMCEVSLIKLNKDDCIKGYYPDPKDESKYFICTEDGLISKSCGEKYKWNNYLKLCITIETCCPF